MSYTVYCHTCPDGKKYVGMTGTSVKKRWAKNKYKSCRAFNAAIEKYGWENISHEVIVSGLTQEEADKMEHDLIEVWDLMNPEFGYHLREGGAHGKPCVESRRLMGEHRIGNQNSKGMCHSQETRAQISNSLKQYYATHRNAMLGKSRPEIQGSKNPNAKSVIQMDLDGNKIAEYPSMAEASKSTGIRVQNISNCCTGYRKHTSGYKWSYSKS